MKTYIKFIPIILILSGCVSAGAHRTAVNDDSGSRISVGNVQRSIKVGMPSSKVIEILGSPNIVTTDEKRREVWVYDKVATTSARSSNSGGVFALLLNFNSSSGATSSSQSTLTIIIKFDNEGLVRDFAYNTSKF